MREVILRVADIALKVRYKGQPRPCHTFKRFIAEGDIPKKDTWLLDSIHIDKKRSKKKLSRGMGSFFFDDPVRIDLNNRRIAHFDSNNTTTPVFNDRLIAYAYSQALAHEGGMLLHAAAVVKNRKAFLFLGRSGDGKSTAASLSKKHKVIGDDVIAVRRAGSSYRVFPTLWKQASFTKGAECARAKAAALFFIKKSNRVSFKPIPPEEALKRILYSHIHFLVYTNRPLLDNIFATAYGFVKDIPAYDMKFTRYDDFWPDLEEALYGRRQ